MPVSLREQAEKHLSVKGMTPFAVETHKEASACAEQLQRYFKGEETSFDVQIDLSATTIWQRKVLETCRQVPFGKTITYGDLAAKSGSPRAARAVGRALAINPVPVIIPCHRVVAADGELGGYSGGIHIKMMLLKLERANFESRG